MIIFSNEDDDEDLDLAQRTLSEPIPKKRMTLGIIIPVGQNASAGPKAPLTPGGLLLDDDEGDTTAYAEALLTADMKEEEKVEVMNEHQPPENYVRTRVASLTPDLFEETRILTEDEAVAIEAKKKNTSSQDSDTSDSEFEEDYTWEGTLDQHGEEDSQF